MRARSTSKRINVLLALHIIAIGLLCLVSSVSAVSKLEAPASATNLSTDTKVRHKHDKKTRRPKIIKGKRKIVHPTQEDAFQTLKEFGIESEPNEKLLTKHLLRRYVQLGIGGRPVMNASETMVVSFGLAMIQMDLNERDNTLTTSAWCRYRWKDVFLQWNPDQFENISSIRLSTHHIWIPDIMLYNTADTQKMERDVLAVVSSDGSILWIPHRMYRSSCAVNVANYPFDKQSCSMTFGSWSYHGKEIDLGQFSNMELLDISDLESDSTSWQILSKTDERKISYYDCCVDPYVTLIFTLDLQRKLVFSSFILTLPCIFLACMTLIVFWLPPERPDRTSLAMSLFSSFLLLLLILVEAAPPTASSIPTLGLYYCFNMVLIMLSIFLSSVVINVSRRGESLRRVPKWLRVISIDGLGRVLCPQITRDGRELSRIKTMLNKERGEAFQIMSRNEHDKDQNHSLMVKNYNNVANEGTGSQFPVAGDDEDCSTARKLSGTENLIVYHFGLMEVQLKEIDVGLKKLLAAFRERELTTEIRQLRVEWQIVAVMLDRFFFLIFAIAIITSLIMLFPRPYQLQ